MKCFTVVPSAMLSAEDNPAWPLAVDEISSGQIISFYPSSGIPLVTHVIDDYSWGLALSHAQSGQEVIVANSCKITPTAFIVESYYAGVGQEVYKSAMKAEHPDSYHDMGGFSVFVYRTGDK